MSFRPVVRGGVSVVSIDLDGQSNDRFSDLGRSKLALDVDDARSSDLGFCLATSSRSPDTSSNENKKLSIVLSKEMHRRAKMQALKEDVTLKHLVLRLLEQHLDQQGTV